MVVRFAAALFWGAVAIAQTVCPPTPQYSPCDLVFDLPGGGDGSNLHAEFRSPRHVTALVNAFSDGGSKWVIRFTPSEAGAYTYRLTSSVSSLNGKEGEFTATAAQKPGWLRAANLHHFALVEGNELTPHLWMGGVVPGFPAMDDARWRALVDIRAAQHFNHLAVTLVEESSGRNFQSPEFFRAAEAKILYANQHGILIDLAFFGGNGLMDKLLPGRTDREKWFRYALSRLAAFDVTWDGLENWESYADGRALLKEIAGYISELDPYKHTRGTRTAVTSAALIDDGWLRYRSYETGNDQIGAVEQQVFMYPSIANFGVGVRDAAEFRRRLWNATADGHYPGTLVPDEASAGAMKIWYDFMKDTRHWELEPFFDVENGRGVALEGVEYVIYLEKPVSVTVQVEKQTYDVEWLNPISGEVVAMKQKNKGEIFTGRPPDEAHDWVLHLSREGHKASMLKNYKFDSREPALALQEIEGNPEKVPFEIVTPAGDTISLRSPVRFAAKLKRDSKALHNMMYEWTGEVTVSERSYRVIGTGMEGTFQIPAGVAIDYPASLHVKLLGLNGLGKVYTADRNYTLTK